MTQGRIISMSSTVSSKEEQMTRYKLLRVATPTIWMVATILALTCANGNPKDASGSFLSVACVF